MHKKILQAVLIPGAMKEEDSKRFMETLGIKTDDAISAGEFVSFRQFPVANLKSETCELVTLDEEAGIKGLIGEAVDTFKSESAAHITKTDTGEIQVAKSDLSVFRLAKKFKTVEVSLPVEESNSVKSYLTGAMDSEMYRLFDLISSALSQEKGEVAGRKTIIETAVGNFMAFVDEALAITKSDSVVVGVKMVMPEQEKEPEKKEEDPAPEPTEKEAPEKIEEPEKEPEKEEKEPEKKSDEPDALEGVVKTLNSLVGLVTVLTETTTKSEDQVKKIMVDIESMKRQVPDRIEKTGDPLNDLDVNVSPNKDKSEERVFAGIFSNPTPMIPSR